MILAIDIGNSNIVFGVFEKDKPCKSLARITTPKNTTYDEIGFLVYNILSHKLDISKIKAGIYSSVVPKLNLTIEKMCENYFKLSPICIHHKLKFPISILYPRPDEIGTDRLVNASAVASEYRVPSIIVDMGTATTFCLLNKKKEYLGGLIAPGLENSKNSLIQKTAKLPDIDLILPSKLIGDTTVHSLQAGFFYSWVGICREIIVQIKKEYGSEYKVIGTGGFIRKINQKVPELFDVIDSNLTLKGLKEIYYWNL